MAREKKVLKNQVSSLFREAHQRIMRPSEEEVSQKQAKASELLNIIEYTENEDWGLGIKLHPFQRVIVKLYYFLPLDEKEKTVIIRDMMATKERRFTEREFLTYLYNEGRCNIKEQDHLRRELILSCGRRAGKTTLSSIFASYELYRLLKLGDPQNYYGLPPNNRIQIISVATDKDQAGLLFNDLSGHINKFEYFKPFIANNTQSYINFRTPADIERNGPTRRSGDGKFTSMSGKAGIRVTFKSSVAKGLRGAGNIVIIMDEMAHFKDNGQSSAAAIYTSVAPSALAFSPKDPDTRLSAGPVESRIISISSPLGKSGKFYDLFQQAMAGGVAAKNLLAIQAPTWEINPSVEPEFLAQKYHEDPATFMVEFGANFSDRVRTWLEDADELLECCPPDHAPSENGLPRRPHFMGIDVGMKDDATVICIGHLEPDGTVVLDYHEKWKAGEEWKVSNPHLVSPSTEYANSLQNTEQLDFEAITDWIEALSKRFYISKGMFDRFTGMPLEQGLQKRGLGQFTVEYFTQDQTSKMYQTAKLLMADRKLCLYDYPRGEDDAGKGAKSPLIKELLDLQAEQKSKYVIKVEKPRTVGSSDDTADALIRMIWLAYEHGREGGYLAGSTSGSKATAPGTMHAYQMRKLRSGGIPERINPSSRLGRRFAGMGRRRG